MDKVNKQELRRLAEAAIPDDWFKGGDLRYSDDKTGEVHGLNVEDERFVAAANPAAILSLLDELDIYEAYIKSEREQLRAELEQYRKDAERYRWITENADVDCRGHAPDGDYSSLGDRIDAAMAKEGGANG